MCLFGTYTMILYGILVFLTLKNPKPHKFIKKTINLENILLFHVRSCWGVGCGCIRPSGSSIRYLKFLYRLHALRWCRFLIKLYADVILKPMLIHFHKMLKSYKIKFQLLIHYFEFNLKTKIFLSLLWCDDVNASHT